MFHRIPGCCEWVCLNNQLCMLLLLGIFVFFLNLWEIIQVTHMGAQALWVLKEQLPSPCPSQSYLCSKGLMLLLCSTSAKTISPTSPSNFTKSSDQIQNPEVFLLWREPPPSMCPYHLLFLPQNSLERPSLRTSLTVPAFLIQVLLSSHSSRTSHPLSLHSLESRREGIAFYLVEHRRARQGPQGPRISSSWLSQSSKRQLKDKEVSPYM